MNARGLRAAQRRAVWGLALAVACAGSMPAVATTAAAPQRVAGVVLGLGSAVVISLAGGSGSATTRLFRVSVVAGLSPAALAMAWLAWTALGLGWGAHAGAVELTTWVAAALFAFAARKLGAFGARAAVRRAALLSGVVQSACALVELASHRPIVGFSGNPDWLGLLLGLCIPLTADLAFAAREGKALRGVRLGAALALAPMLVAFLVAGSRVGMASLLVALVVATTRSLRRRALAAGLPASAAPSSFRDASLGHALADRLWIWRHALTAARSAPLSGVGTGRFAHGYLAAQGDALSREAPEAAARHFVNATSAHGSFLHALVENGVPGAALLLATTARLLVALQGRTPLFFAASLTLALEMAGDVPLHLPPVAYLAGLLLVCGEAPRRRSLPMPASIALVVGAVVAAAFSASVAARSYLGAQLRESSRLDASLDPRARDGVLRRALRVDPDDGETLLQAGLSAFELGEAGRARALLLRSSTELADVGTLVALGNVDAAAGDREGAERWYRRALALDAGSLKAHANLAELCRLRRDAACAEAHLGAALRIAPFHPKVRALEDRVRGMGSDAADEGVDTDTDIDAER